MTIERVLVANRGEIAVRIMGTLADLGIGAVAVHPDDDADALHVRCADRAVRLEGTGPAAYLDVDGLVAAAVDAGCDAVHPGYGFLAENAAFAGAVADAGLVFIGPSPDVLALFGDKVAARRHAESLGVPVAPGIELPEGVDGVDAARSLLASLGPGGAIIVKAAAGGGGRGMRIVTDAAELAAAMQRCASEAFGAFGDATLYAEALIENARHIEVQVIGDGTAVAALGERGVQHSTSAPEAGGDHAGAGCARRCPRSADHARPRRGRRGGAHEPGHGRVPGGERGARRRDDRLL